MVNSHLTSHTTQNKILLEKSSESLNTQESAKPGMTVKVIGGGLWSLTGQVVTLGASLIFTPFVIRLLGTESYGVLALINLLVGYVSFADFGMGTASTKFGSQAFAENDREKEAAVIWTSLFIAFIPALIAAGCLTMFAEYIVRDALRLPDYLHYTGVVSLSFAALGFLFRTTSLILNTPQLVRLRMDLVTLVTAGTGLMQIMTVPLVIWLGGGLIGAAATIAVFSFINLICNIFVSRKLLPDLFDFKFQKSLITPLIKFGGTLVVSSIAGILLINLEKLVLTRFASVTALAYYTVAFTLANLMTIVPNALGQSLLPAFSQLQSDNNKENLLRLFARAIRANFIWAPPVIILLCLIAKPFFTFWAGEEFGRESSLPFYILAVGLAVNIIAFVPYNLIMASGRADFLTKVYCAELLPYIFLALILTEKFGATGAALAWSLRGVVDAIVFLYLTKHILKRRIVSFFRFDYGYLAALSVLLISSISILIFSNSLLVTFSLGTILMLLYGILIWKIVLNIEEKRWINSLAAYLPIRFI
jgi:O-antigen/teichoic acid export membrane protein